MCISINHSCWFMGVGAKNWSKGLQRKLTQKKKLWQWLRLAETEWTKIFVCVFCDEKEIMWQSAGHDLSAYNPLKKASLQAKYEMTQVNELFLTTWSTEVQQWMTWDCFHGSHCKIPTEPSPLAHTSRTLTTPSQFSEEFNPFICFCVD